VPQPKAASRHAHRLMDDVRTAAAAAAAAMARLASLLCVAFYLPLLTLESPSNSRLWLHMSLLLLVYQYVYMFVHHA
jgi:hypothetical protein